MFSRLEVQGLCGVRRPQRRMFPAIVFRLRRYVFHGNARENRICVDFESKSRGMNTTKTKIRTHAIQRPLGREFKYREKIHYTGHPNKGQFSALSDLIPLALKEKGEMTASELAIVIKELWGVDYKRNTISEICTRLCLKNKISKIKKNRNGPGRPKTDWKLQTEANNN